jgi:Outer membrane protein beta-barrel domain
MIRKFTFVMWALVLGLTFHDARAQSDEKKFEAGGQFSVLRVPTRTIDASGFVFVTTEQRDTEYGLGARIGYNFSKYFAAEAEVNFFPRDQELTGGKKLQGLFGVKVGKRFEKFGLFGKARPGFVRYQKGDYRFVGGIAVFPPPIVNFRPVARTNFAFDLGGVAEFYPSKRTIIRFDAGDTIVRLPVRNVAAIQLNSPFSTNLVVISAAAETTHNLQLSVGFGVRF